MQDLVEELERTVQMDLDPARRVLYRLARVVGAPSLDEAQAEDAEATQVVDSDPGGCGEICGDSLDQSNNNSNDSVTYFSAERRRARGFPRRQLPAPRPRPVRWKPETASAGGTAANRRL